MVAQPALVTAIGGSNPGQSNAVGDLAGMCTAPGFEPPTKKAAFCRTTTRPLPVMVHVVSPLLGSKSATDENPFYVFLSNRT